MSMMPSAKKSPVQAGSALLEVMITIAILAIGLLGIAGMQARVVVLEKESFQQTQGMALVNDMISRLNANRDNADLYVTGPAAPLGKGDTLTADCTTLADAARDLC